MLGIRRLRSQSPRGDGGGDDDEGGATPAAAVGYGGPFAGMCSLLD